MSLEAIQALLLSLVPCFFWLWYIQGLGRYRREPAWMLGLALLAGAGSAYGVLLTCDFLEELAPGFLTVPHEPLRLMFYFVVAVGLMEEGWKMLCCWLAVYFLPSFDEPVDGLLYAGCVALGFATAENVKYILEAGGPAVLVGRAILSTFGHVLMSGVWGYALGMQKCRPSRAPLWLLALFAAALGHGLFDWFLTMDWPLAAVAVLAALWWLFSLRIQETARLSPYRVHRVHRVRECPRCGILHRAAASYCTGCGQRNESASAVCANCLTPAGGEERCARCGCLFVKTASTAG
ncbi:PrsW family intramembrane metalloprotease [bacterium CPR1]|nr:PrsW family intramembrane metalloprotease [bacterium CPR1]